MSEGEAATRGTFVEVCKEHNGAEIVGGEAARFEQAKDIEAAAAKLGYVVFIPPSLAARPATFVKLKDQLVIRFKANDDDPTPPGWIKTAKHWEYVVGRLEPGRTDTSQFDDKIRCMESEDGNPLGWYVRGDDGAWRKKNAYSVKLILISMGYDKQQAERIMGGLERDPWKVVKLPFEKEYPARHVWNLNAPQWAFRPLPADTPHWDMVFNHVGDDLTPYLAAQPWAQAAGIVTGGDYIRAWFAALLTDPKCKLPYLFFFGPENSGKSIVHEAFATLVTKGVIGGERALTSDKNGELDGAILCVIEESDIRQPGVRERLKAAVTAIKQPIRAMGRDVYMVDNYTHWIQMSNDINACPKFPGDTRIQPIYVGPIENEIGKPLLLAKLRDEAPAFLHTVATFKLPEATGRLRIPLVETNHSRRLENSNTPAAVLNIIEFIGRKRSWRGTAPELAKLVPETPGDFRKLWRLLESNQVALDRGNVRFEEVPQSPKTKVTKQVILKAAS